MSVRVARADIQQTFNFDGVLVNAINGSTSVTGQFTIDFTTDLVTAFDFDTPYGNMAANTPVVGTNFFGWGGQILGIPTNPTFTDLQFRYYIGGSPDPIHYPIMNLLFESPLSAFTGSSFYPSGAAGFSVLDCLGCLNSPITEFSSGSATPVTSPVPEPASIALFGGVLLFTGSRLRKRIR